MIQPPEMKLRRPIKVHGGISTTDDVWAMFTAASEGDLTQIKTLSKNQPALLTCMYDYTTPLHFAVLQGRFEVVDHLVQNGALDPGYLTHPFRDSLVTMAADRGLTEMAAFLEASVRDASLTRELGDTGGIDHGKSEIQKRFEEMVDKSEYPEVEAMLKERPELVVYEFAFWGEGIMATAAKGADRRMLELLLAHGARVPKCSKWGARYYFKHYEIAKFLLENGMDPDHMNWRGFTLLHDMAFTGDIAKAELLLDHDASIDAVDGEYSSTPLGYAARFGKPEMARLLLARGADQQKAGAAWAEPLIWAEKKGHTAIAQILRDNA
jgi:ankyrin repeat protein